MFIKFKLNFDCLQLSSYQRKHYTKSRFDFFSLGCDRRTVKFEVFDIISLTKSLWILVRGPRTRNDVTFVKP